MGGRVAEQWAGFEPRHSGCPLRGLPRATAVAMQVVLADATSGAVDVANQALAVTEACRRCRADAYAFQFVVAALGRVELSGRGWAQLQVLARRLVAVVRSGVAPSTMGPRVTSIARRVVNVLQREIRVIGPASRLGRSLAFADARRTRRLHRPPASPRCRRLTCKPLASTSMRGASSLSVVAATPLPPAEICIAFAAYSSQGHDDYEPNEGWGEMTSNDTRDVMEIELKDGPRFAIDRGRAVLVAGPKSEDFKVCDGLVEDEAAALDYSPLSFRVFALAAGATSETWNEIQTALDKEEERLNDGVTSEANKTTAKWNYLFVSPLALPAAPGRKEGCGGSPGCRPRSRALRPATLVTR